MYDSNHRPIFIDPATKTFRTEIICRLYEMGFSLVPMDGKKPCIEWKEYQARRATPQEITEWMRGRFRTKDGQKTWTAENLNFAMLTGTMPWCDSKPGVVVVDADDEESEDLIRQHCPPTPMMQITGSGHQHWFYRRPALAQIPYLSNRQKTWVDGTQYNLDVRADGGYILCPGSIHPVTGEMYREVTPWTSDLLESCPVYDPTWLPCEHALRAQPLRLFRGVTIDDDDHEARIAEIDVPVEERERQAQVYLESVPGTQEGTGADRSCSALTIRLLHGFALPAEIAQRLLTEWGQRSDQLNKSGGWYPWTEEEIARKVEWCLRQEYDGEIGDRLHSWRELGDLETRIDDIIEPFEESGYAQSANKIVISPQDQLGTAITFFNGEFGGNALVHHQGCWHRWGGTHYEVLSDDDIKARLWKWLGRCQHWAKTPSKEKRTVQPYQPNRSAVAGIADALKAVTNYPSSIEPPCWLSQGQHPEPTNVIAFKNGLLDVAAYLSGSATLLPHSPDWFSTNCLPHEFQPQAGCPRWLEFLHQVLDGDEDRIGTLQQWFGYNLIADTRQHKMMMLIGPPRSGKGTTMTVLSEMLGKHNIANSSLASLGGRFGLQPLIGKMAALIDEGHLGKMTDTSLVLERLKAISGEAEQTVDRKGLPAISNVALRCRFTLAVNELPRLSDSSAAMRSRLIILPYFNSYEGREDFTLSDRLLSEIPGITNWGLAGLRQLRSVGRFKNPAMGEKILRDFVYLSSPVQAFLDECCEVGEDKEVRRNDLQLAWHMWCDTNGHMAGSIADFGRKLRAVVPRINDERRRVNNCRERWHMGVGLTPEALADIARVRNGS